MKFSVKIDNFFLQYNAAENAKYTMEAISFKSHCV